MACLQNSSIQPRDWQADSLGTSVLPDEYIMIHLLNRLLDLFNPIVARRGVFLGRGFLDIFLWYPHSLAEVAHEYPLTKISLGNSSPFRHCAAKQLLAIQPVSLTFIAGRIGAGAQLVLTASAAVAAPAGVHAGKVMAEARHARPALRVAQLLAPHTLAQGW